jgi:predicted nucleotidyltransferase
MEPAGRRARVAAVPASKVSSMAPSNERIAPVARKHGIILLLQFGSSVSGTLHERSDVDLAVLLERVPRSLQAHAELLEDLQQLFPDREVDLALLNRADPLFLRKISEGCCLLHGSPRELQRFKIYAFKRYQDHRRYLEMERRYVERSLQDPAPK